MSINRHDLIFVFEFFYQHEWKSGVVQKIENGDLARSRKVLTNPVIADIIFYIFDVISYFNVDITDNEKPWK